MERPDPSGAFRAVVGSDRFNGMARGMVCQLLHSNTIPVRDEVEVFLVAVKWLMFDWENRRKFATQVMKCVRFNRITSFHIVQICCIPGNPEFDKVTAIPDVALMIVKGLRCTLRRRFLTQYPDEKYSEVFLDLVKTPRRNYTGGRPFLQFISFQGFLRELERYRMEASLKRPHPLNCWATVNIRYGSNSSQCGTSTLSFKSSHCSASTIDSKSLRSDTSLIDGKSIRRDTSTVGRKTIRYDSSIIDNKILRCDTSTVDKRCNTSTIDSKALVCKTSTVEGKISQCDTSTVDSKSLRCAISSVDNKSLQCDTSTIDSKAFVCDTSTVDGKRSQCDSFTVGNKSFPCDSSIVDFKSSHSGTSNNDCEISQQGNSSHEPSL